MDILDENALDPDFGDRFERGRRPDCQLYLISPPNLDLDFPERLARAFDGGAVAAFQLRLKGMDDHAIAALAEPLQKLCSDRDVAFIINDSISLAKRLGADGVHLGQGDGDPREARDILGRDAQIGVTCHNSRHLAMEAGEAGADYIAFGAFHQSGTKLVEYIADTTLLEWWTTISGVPCVAIGGITVENAPPIIAAGADFIAVSGAVWEAVGREGEAVAQFVALMA
ncbi:MAG: thiamine phosphate synthase [Chakrabartia sp.]